MLTDRQFFLIAVLFYAASTVYSVFLWRKGFRRDDVINYLLLLLGFAFHTTAIFKRGLVLNQCPVYNIYEATTFFTWFSVLAYLVIGLWPRIRFLGAFASPLFLAVGVFALMPSLDPPHGPKPEFTGGLESMHASVALLAYAAFGLSCAAGMMFLTQETNLKQHKLNALRSLLPSIQRLETGVSRLILTGWILMSFGLLSGVIYLGENRAAFNPKGDPKIIWAAVVWIAYLGVLIAHKRRKLTGRRFALAAIVSFIFVALTFWGTNLLSPIHQR
jgi:HemX protein